MPHYYSTRFQANELRKCYSLHTICATTLTMSHFSKNPHRATLPIIASRPFVLLRAGSGGKAISFGCVSFRLEARFPYRALWKARLPNSFETHPSHFVVWRLLRALRALAMINVTLSNYSGIPESNQMASLKRVIASAAKQSHSCSEEIASSPCSSQ